MNSTKHRFKDILITKRSPVPNFRIKDLVAGEKYLLTIQAVNKKGKSKPFSFQHPVPDYRLLYGNSNAYESNNYLLSWKPFLVITCSLGIVVTIVLCSMVIKLKIRSLSKVRDKERDNISKCYKMNNGDSNQLLTYEKGESTAVYISYVVFIKKLFFFQLK